MNIDGSVHDAMNGVHKQIVNEFGFLRTVGEGNFVRIYTANNTETDSVELSLNYQELKEPANALTKFETEVKKFKIENKESLGFTHLHFKDCGSIGQNSKADIVFYVDLDEE